MNTRGKRRGSERRYTVAYRTCAKRRRTIKEGHRTGRIRRQSCRKGYGLTEARGIDRGDQPNCGRPFANGLCG